MCRFIWLYHSQFPRNSTEMWKEGTPFYGASLQAFLILAEKYDCHVVHVVRRMQVLMARGDLIRGPRLDRAVQVSKVSTLYPSCKPHKANPAHSFFVAKKENTVLHQISSTHGMDYSTHSSTAHFLDSASTSNKRNLDEFCVFDFALRLLVCSGCLWLHSRLGQCKRGSVY